MHRSLCRVIRGTCRKWRESECPVISGEEVRKNGHKPNEEFVSPPKYTLTDAVGWATGLVLAYEVTHRRRRTTTIIEECPIAAPFHHLKNIDGINKCPFGWPTKAITQPILSQSVVEVKSRNINNKTKPRASIDLTPFIREDGLGALDFENVSRFQSKEYENDDDSVQFSNDVQTIAKANVSSLRSSIPLTTKHTEADRGNDKINSAAKLTGDLFSVLGAFKFLNSETTKVPSNSEKLTWAISLNDQKIEEPPLSAMELLEKGAELGSSRALYNIGVTYERRNECQLARDYYRKASDLGHPLATYNSAVFLLRDGRISEGLTMMQVAAEKGVPEAKRIISST